MAEEKTNTPVAAEAKAKMVTIRLPRATAGEEPELFVGVNGKGYRIQRGASVEVPEAVAEVIRNSDLAADELDKFLEENEAKS